MLLGQIDQFTLDSSLTRRPLVAAIYSWNRPGGADGLNARFGHAPDATDGGLADDPQDPDFMTPADRDLIARALENKDEHDCRHLEPQGNIEARVACVNGNAAAPTIVLAGFSTGAQASASWDADFRQKTASVAMESPNRRIPPGFCGSSGYDRMGIKYRRLDEHFSSSATADRPRR